MDEKYDSFHEKKVFNRKDFLNWCFYFDDNESKDEVINEKKWKKRKILTTFKKIKRIENS